MIRVRTPSRLHFGLLALPSGNSSAWLNQDGDPTLMRRNFGGVGLMIDRPGIQLSVDFAKSWSAEGPLAERVLQFAHTYCERVGVREAFRFRVESASLEHVGLGTGTQLGLAVARGIAQLTGQLGRRNAVKLARNVGRGARSALGVHGFELGGFLVEGGKISDDAVSPLLIRHPFPEEWEILLITPLDVPATHGQCEIGAFAELAKQAGGDRTTESLCRLVLLGMLPALLEADLETFGEALYDFNRRVGEMFRSAQGGCYAHPRIEQIVKTVRAFGVKGVGQSSWGPTIFALVAMGEADLLRDWVMLNHGIAMDEMRIVAACNSGAILSTE